MFKQKKGFTLVEMLVVIGIFAVLLVLVLVNLNKNRLKARDNIRVSDINVIRLALEEYRATCGVFPATLEIGANNGRTGTCSASLGDFIFEIPTTPTRSDDSLLVGTDTIHPSSIYNGYFYAGLSSSLNGPCYEYHVGAELEFALNNDQDASSYLSEDHDAIRYAEPYRYQCAGSNRDFGRINLPHSDDNGLYDFRSVDVD